MTTYNASTNQISAGGYGYDAAGNLTADPAHTYQYDAEGNLLSVDNGNTETYVYDAWNRRVQQQPVSALGIVYDIFSRATSFWPTASTHSDSHIFADGIQIGMRSGDGKTYFKHTDWLKTDRVHTDLNGAVAATYTSLPFGDGGAETSTGTYAGWDFLRFGDMDFNAETATNHAIFRNYSPQQGRWTTPDPYDGSYDQSNPQSFNRYSYALNSPLVFTDPFGLNCGDNYNTCVDVNAGDDCWWCVEYGWYIPSYYYGGGGTGGGGGGGGSTSTKPTPRAPNNNPCLSARARTAISGTLDLAVGVAKITVGLAATRN